MPNLNRSRFSFYTTALCATASFTLTACAVSRYKSLGIEGIDAENAPYVAAKLIKLGRTINDVGVEIRNEAVSAVLNGVPASCGSTIYDGTPGVFEDGRTATVEISDCTTGAPSRTYTVTFVAGSAGQAPSAETFTALVDFHGILWSNVYATGMFMLDYDSLGSTGPFEEDYEFASWAIRETDDRQPIVIEVSPTKQVELSAFSSITEVLREPAGAFDRSIVNFLLTEVGSGATLEVATGFPVLSLPGALPHQGVISFTDVDGAKATFDFAPSPTPEYFHLVVDSDLTTDGPEFDESLSYETLLSAIYPSQSKKASGMKGWL